MTQMKAAVLSKLGTAPQYQTVSMAAIKRDKSVVKVIASSLKQLD